MESLADGSSHAQDLGPAEHIDRAALRMHDAPRAGYIRGMILITAALENATPLSNFLEMLAILLIFLVGLGMQGLFMRQFLDWIEDALNRIPLVKTVYGAVRDLTGLMSNKNGRRFSAVVMVQLTQRVPPNMVFIPFHFHDCVNRLTLGLLDPYSRQPAFKQCCVKVEHVDQEEAARLNLERRKF